MLVKDVNASDIDPDLLNKTYNGISANAIYRSTFVDCKFRGGIHSFEKKGASARSVLKNLTLHVEPMSSKRPYASTGEGAYSIHYINCTFEMPNDNDNEKVNMIVRHEQFGGSFKNIIINGNGYSCKANFFDLILSGRYHPAGYTPFDVIFNGELTLNRLFRLSSGDPPLALDYTINGNVNTTVEEKNWDDPPPSANAGEDIHKSDSNGDGSEDIILDGSNSYYYYDSIRSYIWEIDGNQIASGSNPTVNLETGIHVITLIVETENGRSGSDNIQVIISKTSTPVNLKAEALNASKIKLNWSHTPGSHFDSYKVY